jgi:hypothetical protein
MNDSLKVGVYKWADLRMRHSLICMLKSPINFIYKNFCIQIEEYSSHSSYLYINI